MRRFDFKIHFDYLTAEQALEVAVDLTKKLRVRLKNEEKKELLAEFTGLKLSHGDFAVLLRRYSALKAKPDSQQLLKDLKWEASFRENESSRQIGFLAEVLD
jgi:hypothetical protein